MAGRALAPREAILDLLEGGYPLGVHTLKAAVLTEDRGRVEAVVNSLIGEALVNKVGKDRYVIAREGAIRQEGD